MKNHFIRYIGITRNLCRYNQCFSTNQRVQMPRRSSPRYSPDAHRRSRYNNGYRDRKMNLRGRGEYREEKDEAVSDDDIRADSRSE